MKQTWSDGNHVELLINGEQYYPRVFEAMAEAREEILRNLHHLRRQGRPGLAPVTDRSRPAWRAGRGGG